MEKTWKNGMIQEWTQKRFPKMVVPLNHPLYFRIFHSKPSSDKGVAPWVWKPPNHQGNLIQSNWQSSWSPAQSLKLLHDPSTPIHPTAVRWRLGERIRFWANMWINCTQTNAQKFTQVFFIYEQLGRPVQTKTFGGFLSKSWFKSFFGAFLCCPWPI